MEDSLKLNYEKVFHELKDRLFPICRSLTGEGNRETLKIIQGFLREMNVFETPSNQKVFDWVIPKEWKVNKAYIKNAKGETIIDFDNNNLHVMGYSTPINKVMSFKELDERLYYVESKSGDVIPYKTSYYNENWGFCISKNQYDKIKNESEESKFHVCIDTELNLGSLTYGELVIEGKKKDEILVSTYICHPSMYNDNLSGIILNVLLAIHLSNKKNNYTYRFLFCPETIGTINWLFQNKNNLKNINCAFVSTCCGVGDNVTFKKSKKKKSLVNEAMCKALQDTLDNFRVVEFSPIGSDERQFSSLGIDIDTGSLMRSPYYEFEEYHTSADDLSNAKFENIWEVFQSYVECFFIIENNLKLVNLKNQCEPMLGKHGLYRTIGGKVNNRNREDALRWVLAYADGDKTLLEIAVLSKIPFRQIYDASIELINVNILNFA